MELHGTAKLILFHTTRKGGTAILQPVISNNILTRMQHLLTTRFFCVCCAYQCNTTLTPAASILYLVCPDRCAVSRCPTGAGKSAPVISGQSFPSLVLLRIFWACKVTEYHFFFLSNCCSQLFRHCCSRSSWPHSNLSDEKTFNGKSSQNWLNYIFLFLLPLLGCTQPSE